MQTNIVWFRNDLRVLDNPALNAALSSGHPVRSVFFVCIKQWQKHCWGNNKIAFVLSHVLDLQQALLKLNIELDIECCDYFTQVPQALLKYLQQFSAQELFYNIEYELNESIRDNKVQQRLAQHNIACHALHDQCLIAPGNILTKQDKPYTVFTPFKRTCYAYLQQHAPRLLSKPKAQATAVTNLNTKLNPAIVSFLENSIVQQWEIGANAAIKILNTFCEQKVYDYDSQRDFPAINATSKLSAYLAVGAVSIRQCFIAAINNNESEFSAGNPGIVTWINELMWRDFYRHIVFHFPQICKGANFDTKYDKVRWLPPKHNLEKWQNGATGIPIIDAAMRQLVTTGWMHNRLRMIVAMFLSKNLLIDWRYGEEFFAQHLVDLDFASNNGGWQWAASTGTDAVPYFRIFNPITQSEKFDPDGKFIKTFCPELSHLNAKQVHNPNVYLDPAQLAKCNYPPLIIDLSQSRLRALEAFKV